MTEFRLPAVVLPFLSPLAEGVEKDASILTTDYSASDVIGQHKTFPQTRAAQSAGSASSRLACGFRDTESDSGASRCSK
jgi:hypothetical protein